MKEGRIGDHIAVLGLSAALLWVMGVEAFYIITPVLIVGFIVNRWKRKS